MLNAIIVADPHFGAIDIKKFNHELDRCLFDRINHMKKLDMFIVAGDLFDMKEYSTSDVFKAVIRFIDKLIERTQKFDTKIVIIKGTGGHDDYQLQTLELIYNSDVRKCDRIKFVHTVSEDEVDGVKFLYIPEEYVLNQDLYYKKYFEKNYDIIIGHGTIDAIWRSRKQKRNDIMSAPVFNVEELCSVANYCYFGHEHMHKAYGKGGRFKYVGPLTVWEYDKTDAGYYIIKYSPKNSVCQETYIPNENAQVLIERYISIASDMTMDMLDKRISQLILGLEYDGLKIKAEITDNCPILIQAKNYLTTKVGLYPNVKLVINVVESAGETEDEKVEREKTEELHATLFSNGLSDEAVIAEYIKSKNGKDIPLDRIKEICGIGGNEDG